MVDRNINLIVTAKNAASGPLGKVRGSMNAMNTSSGRLSGGLSRLGGGLVRVAKVGAAVLLTAILAVTAALVAGLKGAVDEEASIAKLDAALKANVTGWDGNRDAIEKVIASRLRLGFSDDELRASLSTLVTRSGDVEQSLREQALAMDLARLKGIDLGAATSIVAKAMEGNTRALKELGIQLPKTASDAEIFAAIQEKVAGQAEAAAGTAAGKFRAFNVAVGNVMESLGALLLGPLAAVATILNEQVIPFVERVVESVKLWVDNNRPLIEQIQGFVDGALKLLGEAITFIWTGVSTLLGWLGQLFEGITKNEHIMEGLRLVADLIGRAFTLIWGAVQFALTELSKFWEAVSGNEHLMNTFALVGKAIGDAFGWIAATVSFALTQLVNLVDFINRNVGPLRFLAGIIGGGQVGGLVYSEITGNQPAPAGQGALSSPGGGVQPAPGGNAPASAPVAVTVNFQTTFPYTAAQAREAARAVGPELARMWTQQRVIGRGTG